MFTLSDAPNTHNAALLTIQAKGYRIRIEPTSGEYELGDWVAFNDTEQFFAADPLALLGLIGIFEERGIHWQRQPSEKDLRSKIINETYPD